MEGSERDVILVCEVCGEWTVLGGPLAVWRSDSTTFGCECGEQLTLADRLDLTSVLVTESAERGKRAGASCLSALKETT